jgi:DNA invertase Pin-like site-specific DNA recombinase
MVGYARTSGLVQQAGLEAQERDLKGAGCERIFSEQVSSVGQRPELTRALDYVRGGDILAVTRPCRLARSTADLLNIVQALEAKGVALLVLSMGGQAVDTRTPTGKLMLIMLGAIAEFERNLMLERQREGIAKAQSEGRYKGREPTARRKADEVRKLHADGVGASEIAKRLEISRASVYRALAAAAELAEA